MGRDEGEDEDPGILFYETGNVRDDEPPEEQEEGPGDIGHNSGDNIDDLSLHDALRELQTTIVRELLRLVKSGGASEKDHANAIRILKDNGMVAGYGAPSDDDREPADLPDETLEDPDYV